MTQARAVWRQVSPAAGQVLDLLHARVAEPYARHLHEEFALGACTEGVEVIRYRGTLHYSGPGRLADQMSSPPALAEIAAETGQSRYGGSAVMR